MVIIAGFCLSCNKKPVPPTQALTKSNTYETRIDSVTQLIRKNPTHANLFSARAQLYIGAGFLSKAIDDLTIASSLDSTEPKYYNQLADFYLQLGKSEKVVQVLEKGNRLIPNQFEILYRLGNLYFYIQDYKMAMNYLNQAQKANAHYAPIFFTKGLVFLETHDTTKAITSFQVAVEREPDYYDAYMQLGLLFAKKSNPLATDYYQNALRVIPNSYEALYAKAMFFQQTDDIEEAIKVYRYILDEVSPEFPTVHYNLGYMDLLYSGDFSQALIHFDSALLFKPLYPEAVYNKGICYEKMGQIDLARNQYKLALEQKPDFNLAIKGLSRLDKLSVTKN